MGSAKSVPVTPAGPPPHNKHLARVADPRSPSAGILRTPIQVESSPQPSVPVGEQLEAPKHAQDSDPRSPTLGIARTPMKTSNGDPTSPLVKQLSEVFEIEASKSNLPPEPILPLEASSSSELDLPLDTQLSLEDQRPSWNQAELPSKQVFSKEEARQLTETPVNSHSSDKPLRDPETPRSSGSKRNRRKPKGKVIGRSPLTILQDDNSPGTLTPRQGKRTSSLSENVRELKEGAILGTGRLLKTGGRAWEQGQDHDKENQHFPLVES
ncbi:cell division cycle-associated protein 3 isoform X1 [Otolemur garnettii]|uniref:Cell division cycle associated 3 n=1 Tax=Otolemur garnettii TaxID=30611 RepID=H0XMA9_OTOGA|nr:cell division cycle-associated protein 3 isoform X1 [Otolemur garnettii]XP_023372864.1 cell division cycle-associated protein 3 isoform X1 [Otolemur garnettii]